MPVANISSFVTGDCVQFYGTEHSTEQYNDTLCGNHSDLSQIAEVKFEKNDRFFYAKVKCGHSLTVYEDADYGGASGSISADC